MLTLLVDRTYARLKVMATFILSLLLLVFVFLPVTTQAAPSTELNFQARLLSNTGALIPDGDYHVEFRLYDDPNAGTLLWTETYTGANTITVQNGYLTTQLGSLIAFPGSIDWSQEIWLTINIGGNAGTPSWDGEMNPRLKVTAVPYAFAAGSVQSSNGALTGDELAQLAPSAVQNINNALSALRLNQTGPGGLLQLQGNGSDVFTVDKTGETRVGAGLRIGNTLTAEAGMLRWTGADFEGFNGTSWISLTTSGGGTPATATFYDATGGQAIAAGVFSTINLDTTLENSDGAIIGLAADEVTINEAGYYEISYTVTAELATGTRSGFNAKLQRDAGSGFTDVPGSQAFHYGRRHTETMGTSSATVVLNLAAGDVIRIQGQGTSQAFDTVANATNLTITRVTAASGTGGGGGSSFEQGGNTFSTTAVLGTADNNALNIITNNTVALSIDALGAATFNNGLTINSGTLNLNGNNITGVNDISATTFTGNGSGLTALNASNISSGTLDDLRLSSNIARLDTAQSFSAIQTFTGALNVGNTTDTTAGNVRWTGLDLEVYDGSQWLSLTGSGTSAPLLQGVLAFGKVDGATGNPISIDGASTVRNATGDYTVTLDTPATTANYIVQLTVEEPIATLDDVKITLDSQTTNGFVVHIHEGDNGGTADVLVDRNWHFLVIDADAAAGGGSGGGLTFTQGGNAFGSGAILGTTDANNLRLITNGAVALDIDALGAATFNNGLTINSGTLNLNGNNITGVNDISATTFTGNGSGLTALNASNISSGTLDDLRLSSNIARLDTAQSFSAIQTFTGGAILGNFTTTTAGAIRWTGADFQGYDGTQWVSLTGGSTSGTPATATFYDATGGQAIAAGVFSTINLDTTLENSDGAIIGLAADEVTINEAGYYEISYTVTAELATGTRSGFNAKLQRDAGSGFTDVPGSQAFHYGRITTETMGTSSATVVLNLAAGDVIRIQGQGTSQAFDTVANATNLTITRVTAASGTGGGGGSSFEQGGNTFSTTAILGTLDSQALRFVTNSNPVLEFNASGNAEFFGNVTLSSGLLDLNNNDIDGVDVITANSITASGTGLSDLNGAEITTGTIDVARLSADVSLINANQTFTGLPTFSSGLTVGNSISTTAGTIRWTGSDFEGFDGTQWLSLTQSSSTSLPLLEGVLAFGRVNGATGAPFAADGASVVRNSTGDYTVTLDTPASSANYVVQLTVEEGTNQDDINISLDNQTTLGFDVDIREGDNSDTADTPIDKNWHFVVLDPSATAGGGGGGGTSFLQGGNDFGGTAILGTTSVDGLTLITNNTAALMIDGAGDTTLVGDLILNAQLLLGSLPTPDSAAQAAFYSGGAAGKGLVIQGAVSQSENLFEIQDNTGGLLAGFNSSGQLIIGNSTISTSAATTRSLVLPDVDGTICISDQDCGFVLFGTNAAQVDSGSDTSIFINKTGGSGNILELQKNGAGVFTIFNSGAVQVAGDNTAALSVINGSSVNYFTVDTNGNLVSIGSTTPDAEDILLVLDSIATDPSGVNGAQYYNTTLGRFRCFEDGTWKDCIGTRQVRSFIDSTSDAAADNNTTNYWDTAAENNNSFPNLTPSSTTKAITGSVSFETQSATTADRSIVTRVERSIGTPAACGAGTTVGTILSTFTTNNGERASNTMMFLDTPTTTSTVYYTLCADTATSRAASMTINRIRITLEEANNSN